MKQILAFFSVLFGIFVLMMLSGMIFGPAATPVPTASAPKRVVGTTCGDPIYDPIIDKTLYTCWNDYSDGTHSPGRVVSF